MRVLSVNVGMPRRIEWRGRVIVTGIFKDEVEGRVAVAPLNLDGDGQADLTVHGGVDKAVYAYPHEHYAFWTSELGRDPFPPGTFGENLTVTGFTERDVRVGERWRVGSCELVVTQPRVPCFKLAAKFQRPDMIRRFLASRRTGFYFRVRRVGDVGARGRHRGRLSRRGCGERRGRGRALLDTLRRPRTRGSSDRDLSAARELARVDGGAREVRQ